MFFQGIFSCFISHCVFFKFWTLNITNVILQRITAIESTLIKVARIRESYALYNKLIGCSKHGSQVGFDMKKRSCDIVIVRLVYWMDTKPMSWPYAVMSTSHVHISGPSIPVLLTFIVKSLYQNRIRLGKHVHLTNINRKELASLPSVYVHVNKKKIDDEFEATRSKCSQQQVKNFWNSLWINKLTEYYPLQV